MSRWRKFVSRAWPWIPPLLVLCVVWGLGRHLLHHTPLTHDHPTHLFKAWHFYEKMLPTFRLRGFSHFWVFGYPSGELVPFGEEAWVSFFRAITFERLSWLRTYGLSLLGLLGLIGLSGYFFAKHFFGRFVGLLTALMILWDPGGWGQAGWVWFMEFGVWPNSLGVCFLLLSIVALDRLGSSFNMKRFVGAGLFVAAALLSHQVAIPYLPIFLVILLLDRWVRRDLRSHTVRNVLGAAIFGLLLSAFYVIPMVARSADLTLDLGVKGRTAAELATRLVEERIFDGLWHPLVPLGFVGAFLALKRRIPGAVFLSLGTGVFILGSTDIPFSLLHLERVMPSLRKIEATRMLVGAKFLWFPLVAYAAAQPLAALAPFLKNFWTSPKAAWASLDKRWALAWLVGLLLLAPYAAPAGEHLYQAQVKKVLPAENVPFWKDLQPLLAETKKLRASSEDLYRIVYDLPMHDHLSTIAPVYDDTWIYKIGYTPTQAFWAFPMGFDQALFRKLMTKYVVSTRSLSGSAYKLRATFGQLKLYDFIPYQNEPFSVIGAGSGKLKSFGDERIVIDVQGTTKDSRLQLFVSYIDHFRATVNGREVPISPATIKEHEDPFLMEIPIEDGRVVFEYVQRTPDIVGRWATLLVLPALWGWRSARRKPLLRKWVADRLAAARSAIRSISPWHRRLKWTLIAVLVGACAYVVYQRITTKDLLLEEASVFRHVPSGSLKLDDKPCVEKGPFEWKCGSRQLTADLISGLYGTHLCLSAPEGTRLHLERDIVLGSAITGRYDSRLGSGRISVSLGGQGDAWQVRARHRDQGFQFLRFDTRNRRSQKAKLSIAIAGSALHCFDFAVAP